MDRLSASPRVPGQRTPLGDATNRANEDHSARRRTSKHAGSYHGSCLSSPSSLPHNESLVPDGSLAVRHPPHLTQPSPQNKRLSAVINEARPHNPKRDSEISTSSSTSNHRRQTHIGPWQLGKTIGEGGCSRVRIVRHSGTGSLGAAKIISRAMAEKVRALSLANLVKSAETDTSLQVTGESKYIPCGLEREICIMKLLDHPNIVRIYDIWENRNELYLVMEYVEGGELLEYIGKQGILDELTVVHLFRQIVAALLYCHRLHIHHRDLKPENILLDKTNFQIKLVDFGMAALQPVGSKLTTPCGSPHYAAPEVIKSIEYDGAKADIWSCGVILFVMLTGSPPFNYDEQGDLGHLFREIAMARYTMPPDLSPEAQDLIRRILVPDPRRRISLEGIWNHPFLQKYAEELDFVGERTEQEYWVGPPPGFDDWRPLDRSTLDLEIFRNLRTLWHSVKKEDLMNRLFSGEPNQEKYFYLVLEKYRNEQLEDYNPGLNGIAYSNSDHHHYVARPQQVPTSPPGHKRSQSAYSIMNNEHLHSKHSLCAPSSEVSYDPFRASRSPLVTPGQHPPIVTVRRGSEAGSRRLRPATAFGHRTPNSSLRIATLRHNSNRKSSLASRSSRGTPSARSYVSTHTQRRSISRSSFVSYMPSSPPFIVRQASSLRSKRGVSFPHQHQRRPSGTSISTGRYHTPDVLSRRSNSHATASSGGTVLHGTPTPRLVSRPGTSPRAARLKIRKPESPSKTIQSEARKVSMELEKVMEEAFNRTSISSSVHTAGTYPSGGSNQFATPTPSGYQNRPLPPVPDETPKTFLHRKLAETREEIIRKREQQGATTNIAHYDEVLDQIDRLMLPSSDHRNFSLPTRSPEHMLSLPVISEEQPDRSLAGRAKPQARRAVTDQPSIRVVGGSATIAPLNIRKKSSMSTVAGPADENRPGPRQGSAYQPVQQEEESTKQQVIKKKKSSWFRRTAENKEQQAVNSAAQHKIPEAWKGLDDRLDKHRQPAHKQLGDPLSHQPTMQSDRSTSSEFPVRNCVTATKELKERKSFLGLFGKKKEKAKGGIEIRSEFSTSSIFTDLGDEHSGSSARSPETQTNWLYRFLNIKPASKILCFQIGRGKVRQDMVRLLRDWQRFGVRDVSYDRETNTVNARIDKNNHLRIKPVSLVIELFVVLEHGRRARLCLARMTQTKGAASSFRKVADVIEDVFRARGMLVDDENKENEMLDVFGL